MIALLTLTTALRNHVYMELVLMELIGLHAHVILVMMGILVLMVMAFYNMVFMVCSSIYREITQMYINIMLLK